MNDPAAGAKLGAWEGLTAAEQLRLREEYGRYLDSLPRTCDLSVKLDRFRSWLAERGVRYD